AEPEEPLLPPDGGVGAGGVGGVPDGEVTGPDEPAEPSAEPLLGAVASEPAPVVSEPLPVLAFEPPERVIGGATASFSLSLAIIRVSSSVSLPRSTMRSSAR